MSRQTKKLELMERLKVDNAKNLTATLKHIDIYRKPLGPDDLAFIRSTLAKATNQNLVRLERTKSAVTGEKYASYGASSILYDYITERNEWSATQKRELDKWLLGVTDEAVKKARMPEAYKENVNYTFDEVSQMKKDILQMQRFLNSASSTVGEQKRIELKRISKFEAGEWAGGTKIKFANNKEFYDFINSQTFEHLIKQGFSSETLIENYEIIKESKSNANASLRMANALEEFRQKNAPVDIKTLRKLTLKGIAKKNIVELEKKG